MYHLMGPRGRRHARPCGVPRGSTSVLRGQNTGARGAPRHSLSWSFQGRGEVGQGEPLRLASLTNSGGLGATRVASSCLAAGPGMSEAEECGLLGAGARQETRL